MAVYSLLHLTQSFVEDFANKNANDKLKYHNLEHTLEVVEAAGVIGKACDLNDDLMEVVLISAWCHDIGYYLNCENHEAESARIAGEFLLENGMAHEQIDQVKNCIYSTRIPQSPRKLEEKVICDADLYHLATPDFFEKSEKLRQEMVNLSNDEISIRKWERYTLTFMEKHQFFTEYAKKELSPVKAVNYETLKLRVKEVKKIKKLEKNNKNLEAKLSDIKEKRPDRGIETMFRTTSRNHIDLSSIADNKANIMISINSIILSILISVMFRKFEDFPNLVIPTVILTVVCLLTIVFAVLATRPNITAGTFTQEDIRQKKTNLLFFGNFHRMPLNDFEWGIREIMRDREFLYGSMIKDIYFLGKVLGRKYRLLRISYTIFMYGFILSVLSYGVAMIFFQPPQY